MRESRGWSQMEEVRAAIDAAAGRSIFQRDTWATPNCIVTEGVEG